MGFRKSEWFWYILILLPAIIFGIYLFSSAVNVPFNDDEALFFTLNRVHEKPAQTFIALFEQHNDHRMFFSRLGSIVVDFLQGEMNFKTMIVAGYGNLLLLVFSFFLIFKSLNRDVYYFLPVAILIFSPIVYEVHIWAFTSFESTLAIAFSIFALYFLQPSKKNSWYLALPLAMAATVSNLDGLSVLPVGIFWLFMQKRFRDGLLFSVFSVVYLLVFFIGFHFSSASNFPPFPHIVGMVLRGFVTFCGSSFKVLSDSHVALLTLLLGGFILLVYFVAVGQKLAARKSWGDVLFPVSFVEICFLKLLACAFMIALGRVGDDPASMHAMRFQVYSVSILSLFYLFVLSNIRSKTLQFSTFAVFFAGTLFLNVLSYAKYDHLVMYHAEKLKADAYNYPNHRLFVHQYTNAPDPELDFYAHYRFPEYFPDDTVSRWSQEISGGMVANGVAFSVEVQRDLPAYKKYIYPVVMINIDQLPAGIPKKEVYLSVVPSGSRTRPYLIALERRGASWIGNPFRTSKQEDSFSVIFPDKLPDGLYDIALCWTGNSGPRSLLLAKNTRLGQKQSGV